MSVMNHYAGVTRFGYLVVITIPLWDLPMSAEPKVEQTLWAVGIITIASFVTLLLEALFNGFRRTDDLTEAIDERLVCVEKLLVEYAEHDGIEESRQEAITRLAGVGTSRQRRTLQRSSYEPRYALQMSAVVALVGRLVDIAANMAQLVSRVPDGERQRIRELAQSVAEIRAGLTSGTVPRVTVLPHAGEPAPRLPLLREMETTVSLIP
jgi:multidrug resistance protein MdtO